MLTLSFVVKGKDSIKCQFYYNSQFSIFKPIYIKTIFPKLFNMEWNDGKELGDEGKEKSLNKRFLESNTIDELIGRMDKIINNKYCDNFYHNILELT